MCTIQKDTGEQLYSTFLDTVTSVQWTRAVPATPSYDDDDDDDDDNDDDDDDDDDYQYAMGTCISELNLKKWLFVQSACEEAMILWQCKKNTLETNGGFGGQ